MTLFNAEKFPTIYMVDLYALATAFYTVLYGKIGTFPACGESAVRHMRGTAACVTNTAQVLNFSWPHLFKVSLFNLRLRRVLYLIWCAFKYKWVQNPRFKQI